MNIGKVATNTAIALTALSLCLLLWFVVAAPVRGAFKTLDMRRVAAQELALRLNGATRSAVEPEAPFDIPAAWRGSPAQVNAAILGAIARAAEAADVTLNTTIPQAPEIRGEMQIVPVLVEASGRYEDVIALIDALEGQEVPITTHAVSLRQLPQSGVAETGQMTAQLRFRALAEMTE